MKKFYYRIILDEEMKANTLDSIHTQLHPAFQMAVRDGLLRQNPTDGLMAEIKKSHIFSGAYLRDEDEGLAKARPFKV